MQEEGASQAHQADAISAQDLLEADAAFPRALEQHSAGISDLTDS